MLGTGEGESNDDDSQTDDDDSVDDDFHEEIDSPPTESNDETEPQHSAEDFR